MSHEDGAQDGAGRMRPAPKPAFGWGSKLDLESAAGIVRIWWNRADFLGRRSPPHLPEQNALFVSSRLVLSCAFGANHIDQGITGQLENMIDGVFQGAIYLACRRTLSVSIVAHGVADTLDVLLLFFGLYSILR